jgi:hypothetical protein
LKEGNPDKAKERDMEEEWSREIKEGNKKKIPYRTLDCCSVLALVAELRDFSITRTTRIRITVLICERNK